MLQNLQNTRMKESRCYSCSIVSTNTEYARIIFHEILATLNIPTWFSVPHTKFPVRVKAPGQDAREVVPEYPVGTREIRVSAMDKP